MATELFGIEGKDKAARFVEKLREFFDLVGDARAVVASGGKERRSEVDGREDDVLKLNQDLQERSPHK